MTNILGNINDLAKLEAVFAEFKPEIVIHMAARCWYCIRMLRVRASGLTMKTLNLCNGLLRG